MKTPAAPALPDSPAELLRAVREHKQAADRNDVEMMRLGVHWADLHLADPEHAEACFTSPKTFAGEGSPSIDEFCVPEFATMLGRTCSGARRGSPRPRWGGWWTRPGCGSCPRRWRLRWSGRRTSGTSPSTPSRSPSTYTMHLEADLEIPDALALREAVAAGAEHLARLGSADTVDGRRATALGDLARRQLTLGFDEEDPVEVRAEGASKPAAQIAPVTQIVIYAHLSADAITSPFGNASGAGEALCARVEQAGQRLLSVEQVRAWCGRPDAQVVIKQVIDLRERLETKGYTPTAAMREHVIVRDGTCVFPWCGRNARHCDLDHVVPYDHDHPDEGGPTSTDNLAALCRRHHRLKTKGRWRYRMTEPGVFEWTSPLGWTYRRDHTGSRCTGRAWPEPDQALRDDQPDLHPPDQ